VNTYDGKWNAQKVLNRLRGDEVQALVKNMSGDVPGGKTYISHFQPALKKMMGMLNEDEIKKLNWQVEEWNSQTLPKDVQCVMLRSGGRLGVGGGRGGGGSQEAQHRTRRRV
jgi:hypothetical protein